jgi:nitrite reductase (NADH) small subunit
MSSQNVQIGVKLFPSTELLEGERQLVELDGVEIAVFNVDGNLYAIANKCPHQGVPMVYGSIGGTQLPSNPQEYVYGLHNKIISCPLHGWEFDLKTGKTIFAPDKVSIKSYDIKEEEGYIVLSLRKEPKSVIRKVFPCKH